MVIQYSFLKKPKNFFFATEKADQNRLEYLI
jgi:hypothetical protein